MTFFSNKPTVVSTPISAPMVIEDVTLLAKVGGGFKSPSGWTASMSETSSKVRLGPNGGWIVPGAEASRGPNGGW